MAIKNIPIGFRTYYKRLKETTIDKKNKLQEELLIVETKCNNAHKELINVTNLFTNSYNVNLLEYPEFVENKYINGKFLKLAKGMFINKDNNYELVSDLYDLVILSRYQKHIYDINKDIELCDRILNLSLKQYTEILRQYYTEVHKRMILNGEGYRFSGRLGWIVINRCKLVKPKPHLDYAATKKKEKELIASGKKIYDKDKAEFCRKNNIEYNAYDKRVFMTNETCYEIPLLGCKLPHGSKIKFEISDYRHNSLRGLTNDQLIEYCDNDINKILNLPIDLKTKLTLCDKANKLLYTKFIRNESQKPLKTGTANR